MFRIYLLLSIIFKITAILYNLKSIFTTIVCLQHIKLQNCIQLYLFLYITWFQSIRIKTYHFGEILLFMGSLRILCTVSVKVALVPLNKYRISVTLPWTLQYLFTFNIWGTTRMQFSNLNVSNKYWFLLSSCRVDRLRSDLALSQ